MALVKVEKAQREWLVGKVIPNLPMTGTGRYKAIQEVVSSIIGHEVTQGKISSALFTHLLTQEEMDQISGAIALVGDSDLGPLNEDELDGFLSDDYP